MKRLFYFLIVLSCTLWSCGGSDNGVDDPNNPDNPDNPTNITLDISTTDLTFEASGGQKEFTIYCNSDWTITNNSTWCKTDVTNGNGDKTITVTTNPYSETEDQNTNLTIKAGDKTKVLTVTQKHGDAIILTKDKFDVPQEGDNITIEVKSNIEYQVTVPNQFQSWIKQAVKSRALETKNFSFTISANENFDKREGYIVFSGNSLKDTVYVYQVQKNQLILTEDTYNIPAEGKDISVELKANVDYNITIPNDAKSWISQIITRAIRTDQLKFHIEANTGNTNRSTKAVIKDKNSDLSDTIYITQTPQGTFAGDVTLTTIEEVKAFQKAGYKKVNGDLIITYDYAIGKEITTLVLLNNQLEEIEGDLIIKYIDLKNLDGLYGLKRIGGILSISGTDIHSMEGLNNLEVIGGFNYGSYTLESLEGLENLNVIKGDMKISTSKLKSFKGLSNLKSIEGNFEINSEIREYSSDALESFEGLENLTSINGDFKITSTSYKSSSSLKSLRFFRGLNNLKTIGGSFEITSNSKAAIHTSLSSSLSSLESFEGLEKLISIGKDFRILANSIDKGTQDGGTASSLNNLKSFKGLSNLKTIGGSFEIYANLSLSDKKPYYCGSALTSLESFEGIESLISIGGNFEVIAFSNRHYHDFSLDQLKTFKGLNNLKTVGGNFINKCGEYYQGVTTFTYFSSEGLENLISINKDATLYFENTKTFKKLQSIGGTFYINLREWQMPVLLDFPKLETVISDFIIESRDLVSIDGITTLKNVENIKFSNCPKLNDFCVLKTLLNNNQIGFIATECGYNPTKYQILNGQCSQTPNK